MIDTTILLAGAATFALLLAAIILVRRRSFLVRQVSFPLVVAAAAATLEVLALLRPRSQVLATSLSWALLFLGLVTVLRLLGLFLFDIHLHGTRGVRLPPLLPAVLMAVAYLLTALITLRLAFSGFDIGPLVATSAVTSLVLGLALQPILANFFAGLVISLERPFRINDWIRVGDQEGRVIAITWRTTHLRTRDNDDVVIPNAKLADERVLNYYYPHPAHLERIRVGVDGNVPPYRVRSVLIGCTTGIAGILDKPSPEVHLLAFEESAILYELRAWIEDVATAPRIASDLRCRIWEELRKERIALPNPIRVLARAPRAPSRVHPAPPAASAPSHGRPGEAAPPRAHLYVSEGPEHGRVLELDGRPVLVGRSRGATLPLSDPNASKEHLRIEWSDGGYLLTDLGSSFGTRINGQAASRAALRPFDRIAIGDTVIIFERDDS